MTVSSHNYAQKRRFYASFTVFLKITNLLKYHNFIVQRIWEKKEHGKTRM